MFLKNQSQNSQISNINDVINLVRNSGLSPEQFVNKLMSSGKFSQQDLQKAMDFANRNMKNRR